KIYGEAVKQMMLLSLTSPKKSSHSVASDTKIRDISGVKGDGSGIKKSILRSLKSVGVLERSPQEQAVGSVRSERVTDSELEISSLARKKVTFVSADDFLTDPSRISEHRGSSEGSLQPYYFEAIRPLAFFSDRSIDRTLIRAVTLHFRRINTLKIVVMIYSCLSVNIRFKAVLSRRIPRWKNFLINGFRLFLIRTLHNADTWFLSFRFFAYGSNQLFRLNTNS
ncbi:unnamed protein product, partial [Allacma fusca]